MTSPTTSVQPTVTLYDDGTGEVVVDGTVRLIAAGDVQAAQGQAMQIIADVAAQQGEDIEFRATYRAWTWPIVARSDGSVAEISAGVVAAAAATQAAQVEGAKASRRGRVGIAVVSLIAAAALVGCGVLVVTDGRDASVAHRSAAAAEAETVKVRDELGVQFAAAQKKAEGQVAAAQKQARLAGERQQSAEAAQKKAGEQLTVAQKKLKVAQKKVEKSGKK